MFFSACMKPIMLEICDPFLSKGRCGVRSCILSMNSCWEKGMTPHASLNANFESNVNFYNHDNHATISYPGRNLDSRDWHEEAVLWIMTACASCLHGVWYCIMAVHSQTRRLNARLLWVRDLCADTWYLTTKNLEKCRQLWRLWVHFFWRLIKLLLKASCQAF